MFSVLKKIIEICQVISHYSKRKKYSEETHLVNSRYELLQDVVLWSMFLLTTDTKETTKKT